MKHAYHYAVHIYECTRGSKEYRLTVLFFTSLKSYWKRIHTCENICGHHIWTIDPPAHKTDAFPARTIYLFRVNTYYIACHIYLFWVSPLNQMTLVRYDLKVSLSYTTPKGSCPSKTASYTHRYISSKNQKKKLSKKMFKGRECSGCCYVES